MIWGFLAVLLLCVALLKLGALSVWVKVLGGIATVLGLVVTLAACIFLWRSFRRHRERGGVDRLPRIDSWARGDTDQT